ncbi:butyrophilin subfamily 1 member A1-like isoform X2 [Carettochelys insculpta]
MMETVPSFSPGSAVSSALRGYLALCLGLQVPRLDSAQFTVAGPDHPIVVSLGGEAVLPCHLSPRMSAETMEVRWFRFKFSAIVHRYKDGRDQRDEQMPEYQGRTELLKDNITRGSVSLRIHNVQLSDHGKYTCLFQSGDSYEEAKLELQVGVSGSDPHISVEDHQDGGIRITCQSAGWHPEPEAQWRDAHGQLLPSASEKIFRNSNGLFQSQISLVVTKDSNQNLSCSVRNVILNEKKISTISIAEQFFPRVSPWLVALTVILALLAVLIPLASYCVWQQRRTKDKLQAELRWRCAQLYTVDVTLDPDTAHPRLIVSEDRKRVRDGDTRQDLPCNPERFDPWLCVLGAEWLMGGRCYWEVEVGDKPWWELGVCRESVSRKEGLTRSPGNGYWVVWLRDGGYKAGTSPLTPLPVSARPVRVGIFLHYEAGEVSFYNVTDRSPLFTFRDTFSGPLRPYFCPGLNCGETNAAPLTICPVPAQPQGISVPDRDPAAQTGPSQC